MKEFGAESIFIGDKEMRHESERKERWQMRRKCATARQSLPVVAKKKNNREKC